MKKKTHTSNRNTNIQIYEQLRTNSSFHKQATVKYELHNPSNKHSF